ncbi:MAG: hypothetical protein LC797_20365 [Chloroflexi bacterium]|nr:hypothetical protein [Chloroflexota bacterium]
MKRPRAPAWALLIVSTEGAWREFACPRAHAWQLTARALWLHLGVNASGVVLGHARGQNQF